MQAIGSNGQHPGCRRAAPGEADRIFSPITRQFSTESSTSKAFDRELKLKQRDNAARLQNAWKDGEDDIVDYNYFRQELASRLVDRLDDIKREEGFPLALDIGKFSGAIFSAFQSLVCLISALLYIRCGSGIYLQSDLF